MQPGADLLLVHDMCLTLGHEGPELVFHHVIKNNLILITKFWG